MKIRYLKKNAKPCTRTNQNTAWIKRCRHFNSAKAKCRKHGHDPYPDKFDRKHKRRAAKYYKTSQAWSRVNNLPNPDLVKNYRYILRF